MTPDAFRKLALSLPAASESAHQNHPDFRVRGKVFASLGYPDDKWGMIKLTPTAQRKLIAAAPQTFVPAAGAWGRQGSTCVQLSKARKADVLSALVIAWRNVAPKRLAAEYDE